MQLSPCCSAQLLWTRLPLRLSVCLCPAHHHGALALVLHVHHLGGGHHGGCRWQGGLDLQVLLPVQRLGLWVGVVCVVVVVGGRLQGWGSKKEPWDCVVCVPSHGLVALTRS